MYIDKDEDDNTITHDPKEEGYDFFIKNKQKKEFHFKILSFFVLSGLLSVAVQVTKDNSQGYKFEVLSDFDADMEHSELLLKARIKRGVNMRHIKGKPGYMEIISKDDQLRGYLGWNDDYSDTEFNRAFIIDGKRVSVEDLLKMLEPFEGFQFKFEIFDPSEDIYK